MVGVMVLVSVGQYNQCLSLGTFGSAEYDAAGVSMTPTASPCDRCGTANALTSAICRENRPSRREGVITRFEARRPGEFIYNMYSSMNYVLMFN